MAAKATARRRRNPATLRKGIERLQSEIAERSASLAELQEELAEVEELERQERYAKASAAFERACAKSGTPIEWSEETAEKAAGLVTAEARAAGAA